MSRFENLIKENLKAKNPLYAAVALLETIIILGIWIFISQLSLKYIMRPIIYSHPQKIVFEMNFAIYVLLFTPLLPLSILVLWRGFVQKMNWLSIFSAFDRFRLNNFLMGILFSAFIVLGISTFVEPDLIAKISTRFAAFGLLNSIILMLIYVISFCVQSTFEEALFRASFVQNLRALGLNIFIAIPFAAFFFALFHMSRQMPSAIFFATFLMAITFSYAAWRTQGIELSMGAHIANNIVIGAIFGQFDNAQGANTAIFSAIAYSIFFVSMLEIAIKFRQKTINA